jgi:hypothetical protein
MGFGSPPGSSDAKIGVRGLIVRRSSQKMKKINRSAEGTIVSASFPSIYCCSFSCFSRWTSSPAAAKKIGVRGSSSFVGQAKNEKK